MYCHFVGERLKDMGVTREKFTELHYSLARDIERLWNGVGDWLQRCTEGAVGSVQLQGG